MSVGADTMLRQLITGSGTRVSGSHVRCSRKGTTTDAFEAETRNFCGFVVQLFGNCFRQTGRAYQDVCSPDHD